MRRLVFASMREAAGKTSVIVGLGRALGRPFGYMKPFGDRLLYRKKRLWDYDSALIANIFELKESPEDISLGFDHSKLRFMYDEAGTKEKLGELLKHIEADRDIVFIEAGRDLGYGISVNLDPVSLARYTDASLVIVTGGDERTILDDITFVTKHLDLDGVSFAGVIVNRTYDVGDFKNTFAPTIAAMGVQVLGTIPYESELTHPSVGFLSEILFAKVLGGEVGLSTVARNIFVGAMSADQARRHPSFGKQKKLVITSGDRSDMILASLEGDTAGLVLTNNISPSSKIIAKATELGVPLLLVPDDTYQVAKQIDDAQYLLKRDEAEKIDLLEKLVRENVNLQAVLGE
jgi:BioD-like phosphotransacetylase family protein